MRVKRRAYFKEIDRIFGDMIAAVTQARKRKRGRPPKHDSYLEEQADRWLVREVDELRAGGSISAACHVLARHFGVSAGTLRRRYYRAAERETIRSR